MILQDLKDIGGGWDAVIGGELQKPYLRVLDSYLDAQYAGGKTIYPARADMFTALRLTPLSKVKAVILGQDPYHGPGQAHGLSFSVRAGVKAPPSLKNIYKEIERDTGKKMPVGGDLSGWARQGVLLLNATLSVEEAKAGSHQKRGWEEFTDALIHRIAQDNHHVVFMLWGAYAQKKGAFIDRGQHLVLESVHPSPLSAHRGFIGCGHFSKANDYLQEHGRPPIDWHDL